MNAITNASGVWPVGYRVLVRPDDIEEKTAGGIVIAETIRDGHQSAQSTGTLVAVGLDAWADYRKSWAKVGDRVLFARYGGLLVDGIDGNPYRLLNDEQISGVVAAEFTTSEIAKLEKRRAK